MMKPTRRIIAEDTSRFTHGAIYHTLRDRPLAEARRLVVGPVPEGATIFDKGCGTVALCFELRARKNCRAVGVDLSRRMIEFAQRGNRHESMRLVHGDGTDLADLEPSALD